MLTYDTVWLLTYAAVRVAVAYYTLKAIRRA